MKQHQEGLTLDTSGQGLYEFTATVNRVVMGSGITTGLCTIMVLHTSASLVIQENADPSAQRDLEAFIRRLVPENDPEYTHIHEGPDDMPAHIKSALTKTMLSVPITDGRPVLGTWQGIFLWEHRDAPRSRKIVLHIQGD
jgi:secondary thiamine-phosphate synthase enzyme